MFLISCGITISHVYCSKGEQWVIGAEMPTCQHPSKTEICSNSSKKCHKIKDENRDKRKKDTYDLMFEFVGDEISIQEMELPTCDFTLIKTFLITSVDLFNISPSDKGLLRPHSPPDLYNPDLTQIQVFLI